MATTMVTVNVPDGVYEGMEFIMEYEGQSLNVVCPDGCGPGSEINLEVPAADPPAQVEIIVPDGCYPGMEFTVDFEGQSFNVAVPDGVTPGQALLVDVPAKQGGAAPPLPPIPPPPPMPAPSPNRIDTRFSPLKGGSDFASKIAERRKEADIYYTITKDGRRQEA